MYGGDGYGQMGDMNDAHEGENPEVISLVTDLKSKKGCIKCILGTAMCCYVLALIFIILFMFAKPGCYTKKVGSVEKKVCASEKDLKMLKIVAVVAGIFILIKLAIVAKLYHSIKAYEVDGINTMLKVLTCLLVLSILGRLYRGYK